MAFLLAAFVALVYFLQTSQNGSVLIGIVFTVFIVYYFVTSAAELFSFLRVSNRLWDRNVRVPLNGELCTILYDSNEVVNIATVDVLFDISWHKIHGKVKCYGNDNIELAEINLTKSSDMARLFRSYGAKAYPIKLTLNLPLTTVRIEFDCSLNHDFQFQMDEFVNARVIIRSM